LKQDSALNVGVNEPYAPSDRVYYTLERHARPRNAPCAMIEIRNNEIADAKAQTAWASRLAEIFRNLKA
jgi:predicted N-formylglutamate amidohydrolase